MKKTTNKYKDFKYSDSILELLEIELSVADRKRLDKIYSNYEKLENKGSYEDIIEDLYILSYKRKLSTSEIAKIYGVSTRSIQKWLKDLGLNRNLKAAAKIKNKGITLDLDNTANTSNQANSFGIEIADNSAYPEALRDFINYLETIKGKSQNTINGYKIDLCLFFKFLKVYKGMPLDPTLEFSEIPINDIDNNFIKSIKLTDLYAFLSFAEKSRGNGTYARARKVASLKSFFKFLNGKAKIIDDNPALELESPKLQKRQPVYLTLDQSVELLHSLDKKDKNYYRDYCILTLFLNCGMRLSELCSIDIRRIKGDTLTIVGKGDKERTVYLNEACLKAIKNYMKVRDTSKLGEYEKNFLFISSRNKPINKRTVELLVKKHIGNAGITDGKYTPHKLRHTAATLMYKYGNVDIRSLQNILGHENLSTTQIYTHVDDESLRDAVKSNPLSKL
ncbi:MAG: tyrosine recombinase XerC [Clostridium sp.]|nr:tyrosine recombinase XerC [Clostridium sp.]